MVTSDRLNVSVKAWSLTWTCKGTLITSTLSKAFNLLYHLAWFIVQTRITKYSSTSLPWVILQGWSVKLCSLDSSVLSLFSICLTSTARNTTDSSCSIWYVFFHFPSLLNVNTGILLPERIALSSSAHPGWEMRWDVGTAKHIRKSSLEEQPRPTHLLKYVFRSFFCSTCTENTKTPRFTSSLLTKWRCYNNTASQEIIVKTIKLKLSGN